VLVAAMQDNELQLALQQELASERQSDQRRWRELLVALVLALALGAGVSLAFGRWTRSLFLRYQQDTAQQNQAIRDREALLRAVFDNAAVGIAQLDTQGRFLQVNPCMAHFLGHDAQALVEQGTTFRQITSPADLPASLAAVQRLLAGEETHVTLEKRYLTAGGVPVWGNLALHLVRDAGGQPAYFIAALHDITDRKRAEAQLKLAAGVFTHAREGIMITEVDGTIVDVNAAFTDITGYSREDVVGQNPRILSSHLHTPQEFRHMWSTLISTGQWYGEVWNRRKNGEVFAEMQTISAVRDEAGVTQNYVALFSDITAIKEHQRQLEHIAHFDVLTGLPNRVLLADRLQQAMYQCQRRQVSLAVVYLDLDGFKAVNDAHGHDAGDELLRVLAQRMKDALRGSDTLARVGGDEFVAVLVDLVNGTDSEPLLTRMLLAASSPVEVTGINGKVVLQVSASAGVTVYPDDNTDADLLMRHADQAMYAAKQAGKNRHHLFDLAQDAAIQIQRETLDHIHGALLRQEFVLFYQPKINMRTGQVTGAEALIRWQHPERGLLSPSAFLPVIESDGLSIEMGEWVVRTALDQMKAWHQQGLDLPVSVNIGAHQLQQPGFAERLSQLLAEHPGVDPRTLQLEVLETSALEDMVHVSRVMRDCHSLGVSFALDDFGTGYSSLTYLKRLPAETLKIDQSFVRDMLDDTSDMAIVSGVIGLAKAFGREVIAEGVESAAHSRQLLTMGCELAQGYGIARPMPAADVPDWVARWSAEATWTA
jgi:diguanylate cyclase (GGDEF)-like protein/PAS domain S-box-containing protein